MSIRFQIGFQLSQLPNVDGFRFRGVLENGDLLSCRVVRDINGMHSVISEDDNTSAFNKLRGWVPWLPTAHGIKEAT